MTLHQSICILALLLSGTGVLAQQPFSVSRKATGEILLRVHSPKSPEAALSENAAAEMFRNLREDPLSHLEFHATVESDARKKEFIARIALLVAQGDKERLSRAMGILSGTGTVRSDTFLEIHKLLLHPDEEIALQAARILGMLPLPQGIDPSRWAEGIYRLVRSGKVCEAAKAELLDTMARSKASEALEALREIIAGSTCRSLRESAVLALRHFPAESTRDILQELAQDPHLGLTALETLGRNRDADSISFLIEMLDEIPERKLRARVVSALRRISLVTSPRNAAEWREWWEAQSESEQAIQEMIEGEAEKDALSPEVSARAILLIERHFRVHGYMADFLVQCMASENESLRQLAARAISAIQERFGTTDFEKRLCDMAREDIPEAAWADIVQLLRNLQANEAAARLASEFE